MKLEGLAIFSAGIKTKKSGALTSADFSTTKHIDSVYMRARATGEFTRAELTKAGNVTELPNRAWAADHAKDGLAPTTRGPTFTTNAGPLASNS